MYIIQQIQNNLNNLINSSLLDANIQIKSVNSRYENIVTSIEDIKHDFGINSLIEVFNQLDEQFRSSPFRKANFHVKAHNYRTILTFLGEVRFKRTIYKNKHTGEYFTYLDHHLGLDKYKYLDPNLEALLVSKMAEYSMAESARQINARVSKYANTPTPFISRQLARNIMLRTDFDVSYSNKETPNSITIMADEKWVSLQRELQNKLMVKSAVIYETIEQVSKGRTRLVNKSVLIDTDNINEKLYAFVNSIYDLSKVKRINIIGDGAPWIKGLRNYFISKDYKTYTYIDLFHYEKAVWNICKSDEFKDTMRDYILNSKGKKDFSNLVNDLAPKTKLGKESLQYIINNYSDIKRVLTDKIKCSMEGHISHNLASLYASRPRGYRVNTLTKLIKLREAKLNGVDIAKTILSSTTKHNNRTKLDMSIFDKEHECRGEIVNNKLSTLLS